LSDLMRDLVGAVAVAAVLLTGVGCSTAASPAASAQPSPTTASPPAGPSTSATMLLTSTAFADGAPIPREHTCDGANTSPPLSWSGVPAGTQGLLLVVDDIEANAFTHWIALDLPPTGDGLPATIRPSDPTPQQGTNDFQKPGWGGPCPPSGIHHYRFTLTALDRPLGLDGQPRIEHVQAAMAKATVLGTAVLTGTYERG
jgi:Raf kinase inhibitor-like YbhB/YbcL family protein